MKILAVLLVLVFASMSFAVAEKVLVAPAWNETIEHPAVYENKTFNKSWNKTVVICPAWNETIEHPAVYENRTVNESYNETIEHPAINKTVEVEHDGWWVKNPSATILTNGSGRYERNANDYRRGYVFNGFKVVDDTGNGNNKMWESIYEIIEVPSWNETVEKIREVVKEFIVSDAWSEVVNHDEKTKTFEFSKEFVKLCLVSPAWNETIFHDAIYEEIECNVSGFDNGTATATLENEKQKITNMKETGLMCWFGVGLLAILASIGGVSYLINKDN